MHVCPCRRPMVTFPSAVAGHRRDDENASRLGRGMLHQLDHTMDGLRDPRKGGYIGLLPSNEGSSSTPRLARNFAARVAAVLRTSYEVLCTASTKLSWRSWLLNIWRLSRPKPIGDPMRRRTYELSMDGLFGSAHRSLKSRPTCGD